jgi:hypothetical protein
MYLIDSDVFIQAKNMHYGFDICPAFWEWLERAHANAVVFSIAKVHEELRGTQDEVTEWADAKPAGFFLQPDDAVVNGLSETSAWLIQTQYTQAAQNEFLQKADYYLVGHGRATGFTVVSHERAAPGATSKVKIPDACSAMGVRCISPWELLRTERARFILERT